jgi:hypothetical protein
MDETVSLNIIEKIIYYITHESQQLMGISNNNENWDVFFSFMKKMLITFSKKWNVMKSLNQWVSMI